MAAWLLVAGSGCVVRYDATPDNDTTDVGGASDATDASDGDATGDVVVDIGTDPLPVDVGPDAPDASTGPRFDPVRWPNVRACADDLACTAVLVVAHRGLHASVPENSLASIRAAAAAGLDFAEVDVRTSSDGVLVLMHDGSVDRTTDGSGDVAALSYDALQALRLRDSGDNPEANRVPRFDEALLLAARMGVALYVDVKDVDVADMAAALGAGNYLDTALVRDDAAWVAELAPRVEGLWSLVPVTSLEEAEAARAASATAMVEIASPVADAALTASLVAAGFRVQQDVMFGGDAPFLLSGSTDGWRGFVDAGVTVVQSDVPVDLLAWLRSEGR